MLLRWLSAAAGIPIFVGLCLWGRTPFSVAVLLLALLGAVELLLGFHKAGHRPNILLALNGVIWLAWGWFSLFTWQTDPVWLRFLAIDTLVFGGAALLFVAVVWEVLAAARSGELRVAQNLGYGLVCFWYVSLFGGLMWLRYGSEAVGTGRFPQIEVGAARVLVTVFCVWAVDSFALFGGKAWGKRKLAPALSPGKTVEGAVVGLVAGMAVGAAFGYLLLGSWLAGLLVGAAAGIVGPVGDLFESALKREVGVKDLGALIPGHGGVLDRFDSLLFVAPVAAIILLWLAPVR
jgi:phosphatidate cytidylyltransferase